MKKNYVTALLMVAAGVQGHVRAATAAPDSMAVTLELDRMLLFGVKGMYGWACYVCVFVVIGFLFFDSPIRRHHARMIPWASVGRILKRYYQLKDE